MLAKVQAREVDRLTSTPKQEWPSLDVVREELDIEVALQAKLSDTADARAGVLLGFSGALAGLAAGTKSLWAVPGGFVAVGAAICAAKVLRPGLQNTLEPGNLFRLYVQRPQSETKQEVLKRRVTDYELNQTTIKDKIKRLKRAIFLLATAVVLVFSGVVANLIVQQFTNKE